MEIRICGHSRKWQKWLKTYLGITKNQDDNSKVDMSHQIYPVAGDTYRRCAGVVTSGVSNALGGKADNVISLSNNKLDNTYTYN